MMWSFLVDRAFSPEGDTVLRTNLIGDFESFQQSHKLLFEVRLLDDGETEKNKHR